MKKVTFIVTVLTLLTILYSCGRQTGEPVAQTSLPRIDLMPGLPQPLKIID